MNIEVVIDAGLDEATGLPLKKRMTSLALNETGYANISYSYDLYDKNGVILIKDHRVEQYEVHPQVRYSGSEEIPADELSPEMEVFINDIKPLIEDILETL